MNHQVFERKWRFWLFPEACLSECRFTKIIALCAALGTHGRASAVFPEIQWLLARTPNSDEYGAAKLFEKTKPLRVLEKKVWRLAMSSTSSTILISDQAGLPAEFKHINKRRNRN